MIHLMVGGAEWYDSAKLTPVLIEKRKNLRRDYLYVAFDGKR
jgi:hypothetical protein